ncbi:MAG: FAD-dependent oxidoreductase [Desulfobacterales bacterium]|jgi:3-oxosteroid 1-dehydrogenase|nr:FAD-dependent oxidoreductase [Desulfobacteraceae bacterium]MBT7697363.1 FAD-dependent oxidoreductase [Desulfobacterales bacterium]
MIKNKLPSSCDALVIGSGSTALISALKIKDLKPDWSVWVVEKTQSLGGTSAYSGGGIWMPGHSFLENPENDLVETQKYLKTLDPSLDDTQVNAYLETSPRVFEYMRSKGIQLEGSIDYPDYYPGNEGFSFGRTIFPAVYKSSRKIRSLLREKPYFFLPFTLNELTEWGPHRIKKWNKTLLTKRAVAGHFTMGQALIGFQLEACNNAGVNIALGCNAEGLLIHNSEVTGVVVNGKTISSPVVIMGCGGFAHNPDLYQYTKAVRPVLSVAPEECETGGGLALALDAGLKIGNSYCWWTPIMKLFSEGEKKPGPDLWAYHGLLYDRCWPGGIMVNGEGRRFINESANYNAVGSVLATDKDPDLDNVWLIWGDYYVKNYVRGVVSKYQPAKKYMNKSKNADELASKIGVPASNLKETLERWNKMAGSEKDDDFQRGEAPYDQYMGDRFRNGHPNIAQVDPPFQAVRVYPGCLGTKVGPVTDEFGRVHLENGEIVSGLYAAGNAAASFLKNIYPGAGGSLGPAVVFGYRAACHAAGK